MSTMKASIGKMISDVEPNISNTERVVSLISGGVLLARAIKKRSWLRGVGAGYALFRGATGYCPVQNVIGKEAAHLLVRH